jgi:hypothetical protein
MEEIFGAIIFSTIGLIIIIAVYANTINESLKEIAKEIRRK